MGFQPETKRFILVQILSGVCRSHILLMIIADFCLCQRLRLIYSNDKIHFIKTYYKVVVVALPLSLYYQPDHELGLPWYVYSSGRRGRRLHTGEGCHRRDAHGHFGATVTPLEVMQMMKDD